MDQRHTLEERKEVVRKVQLKMADSRFELATRKEVIMSAVRKHHKYLHTAKEEGRSIYRTGQKSIGPQREGFRTGHPHR